jgi:hypothetical protein
MKDTAAAIEPGTAALFVLVRKVTADKVLEGLKGEGGKVMKTSLDHTKEAALHGSCQRPSPPDFDPFTSTFPEQERSNDPSEIRVRGSGYRTCCRGTGPTVRRTS